MIRRPGSCVRGLAWVAAALALVAAPAHAARHAPVPVVRTLDNGMRVAVFEIPRLPIVQMQLLIPAGTVQEPDDQPGIANLTAQLLRRGTATRDAATFGSELERLGATFGVSAGREFTTLTEGVLARDFESGLELLADAALHPVFPAQDVDPLKQQVAAGLQAQRANPVAIADAQTWSALFAGHPYARPPAGTPEGVALISREQIRRFHAERYRPDHAVLAIAGDVTPERALAVAKEWFGAWSGTTPPVSPAALPAPGAMRIRLIDQPGTTAEIRFGAVTASRAAADYLSLAVANFALGGGPGARLARSAAGRGVTGARSTLIPMREAGLFTLATNVPVDSAAAAIAGLRAELQRLDSAPPSETEVAPARRLLRNIAPLQFESLAGVTSQWLAADFYGLPADEIARQRDAIDAVTAEAAGAAAKRWLSPAARLVVVVGPADRLRTQLAPLGTIELARSASDTGAVRTQATIASPQSIKAARELLAQVVAAYGGKAKLEGIKTSSVVADVTITGQGNQVTGQMEQIRAEPWRMVYVTRVGGFETRQVLDGRRAWTMTVGDSTSTLEADSLVVAGLRSGFSADLPHLLRALVAPGAHVVSRGRSRITRHPVDVLELDSPEVGIRRCYFDTVSHLLWALDQGEPGGEVSRRLYSDFRPVNGIQWPYLERRLVGDSEVMRLVMKRVALNLPVKASLFARPSAPVEPDASTPPAEPR